ncbi:MAG TPA: transglycosylase SLT domain-containing protein [Rhodospirillaceae bacterium]|nr:transglycosylase SLT domain-containing protein [Rhodospirillaceae bacterium]
MRRVIYLTLIVAGLCCQPGAAKPALAATDQQLCGEETARQEAANGIPRRLLHAISLVESGRWDADRRASFAWPWTVTAEGEGRYLPTKRAAVDEVRRLQADGVRNIDVGCMQVNLQAHPDAFSSLDEAFEPATNVAYAAQFLIDLFRTAGDWPTAGAWYHSQTPELASGYKAKLMTTWTQALGHRDEGLQLASTDAARPPLGTLPWAPPRQTVAPVAGPAVAAAMPPPATPRVAEERTAAKRLAEAYRQTRLAEYRQRKGQLSGG